MKRTFVAMMYLAVMMAASTSLKAQEVTITLNPGWTWISVPLMDTLDFPTALGSFTPMQGDIIKSQWGSASYRGNGQWRGSVSQFYPGYGYMYKSNRTLPVNVIFQAQQSNPQNNVPMGAIVGLFSVSESQQVYFSQGNLQYQASTNTWRFAENQWDCLRLENANISSSYDGWIDLFGWGTSGYDHGAVCYQPWSTSTSGSDYYAYGSSSYNLYDQTGKADWGYNAISNGGNTENHWRTLTSDEWSYLIFNRDTPSGIRFAKAIVNGIEGLVVLPDNWDSSIYGLNETDSTSVSYSANVINENDWMNVLEVNGALFLPAGSYRNGSSYIEQSNPFKAYYWTSSKVKYFEFNNSQLFVGNRSRNNGLSVRLARSVESNPTPSVSIPSVTTAEVTDITQTTAICGGVVTDDGGATVTERGICWSMSPNPTTDDNHVSSGEGTGSYTVNMIGLVANTTYYVRAYATNSVGIAYGEELSFITLPIAELPTITTSQITDITQTTAFCGGVVTDDGGAIVTERGICWSMNPNPTTSDNYVIDTTSTDSFTIQMVGLNAFTTYYVRACATNCMGTAYGSELSFTTVPGGAINGLFSVSATQQVYFSQGNLQFKAYPVKRWRFAPNQYDYIGTDNTHISESYEGWIDLFGWGTSGYNHGAYCYQPWSINQSYWSYYAYGNENYDLNNQTGKADWGYNFNPRWRTLTQQEWSYLLFNRTGSRFAKGRVNGVDGLIILPDNWSYCTLNKVNQGNADYGSNIFTANQWGYLEQQGAVFLPVAGMRVGITVSGFSNTAAYWSATHANLMNVYCMYFSGDVGISESQRYYGRSVRLVRNAN